MFWGRGNTLTDNEIRQHIADLMQFYNMTQSQAIEYIVDFDVTAPIESEPINVSDLPLDLDLKILNYLRGLDHE